MNILIVDDDEPTRDLLCIYLRSWGYECATAADGQSALEMVAQTDFDIVLSDWLMPGLQGPELVARIRGLHKARYTYIILCTIKGQSRHIVEGIEAGADDYVTKPFDRDVLKVRIQAGQRLISLQHSLEETNQRLEVGLKQARMTLNSMLPASTKGPLVDIAWIFRPSTYIGGDLFNVYHLDDERVSVYAFDVAGHGIASALFAVSLGNILRPRMAYTPRCFEMSTFGHDDLESPQKVAEFLNERFPFEPPTDTYFTLFYAVIDRGRETMDWVRAGHPPPVVLRENGLETLDSGEPPIGFFAEQRFTQHSTRLSKGDRLILYSDGITEAQSPQNELFGFGRLHALIGEHGRRPLSDFVSQVESTLFDHRKSHHFEDDLSFLVVHLI